LLRKCAKIRPRGNFMTTTARLITAEDLLRIPEDGLRHELVRGELREIAPAGHKHGRIVLNVTTPLDQHVRANKLGAVFAAETGFKLAANPDSVRAPDVAFVRQERLFGTEAVEGYWPGAPDLVVEVISPGDIYTEVEEKVTDWLDAGSRMVVLVNPRKRSVTVYCSLTEISILTESDVLDGRDVVPGWAIPVKDIFQLGGAA
jgi:Uma2 family endonuclease